MQKSSTKNATDGVTKRALSVVVRRILRTRYNRTQTQKMVLREEGRLRNTHSETLSIDSIADLIVAKMLSKLPNAMLEKSPSGVASVAFSNWPTVVEKS